MSDKLQPCPFCGDVNPSMQGQTDRTLSYEPSAWVECETCGAQSRGFCRTSEAMEAWNRRTPSAQPAGEPVAVVRRSMTGGNAGLSRHVEITADFILNDGELLYTHPPAQRDGAAVAELKNIVNAKRFDVDVFEDDAQFADWVQSRARHILSAEPAAKDRTKDLENIALELKVRIINAMHLLDAGATKEQLRCHLSSPSPNPTPTNQRPDNERDE